MPDRSRDAAYTAFVADERGLLLGVAWLMYGSRSRAWDVVAVRLAELYGAWSRTPQPRRTALREVLTAQPRHLVRAWRGGERFELVDASASGPLLPDGVVADLAGLGDDARRVVILQRLVGLAPADIADLLDVPPAQVESWASEAVVELVERKPERAAGRHLDDELMAAVGPDLVAGTESDPSGDMEHGRELLRRRLLRTSLIAAAVVVATVLGLTQVVSAGRADPVAAGLAATPSTSPRPTPSCDTQEESCQADLAREWRLSMAKVAGSYVDPHGRYFSGYTYSYNRLYDSPGIWAGKGGVLGLDLFRLAAGGTEVYLQIATDAQHALRCGQSTHQPCYPIQFMDGNVFTMTQTSFVDEGLEVQYSPTGGEVITVVARNRSKGATLRIGRAELVSLVQDPRLRLPPL